MSASRDQVPASVGQPGDVVGGRYRLEQLIGSGGFGAVFRAVQLPLGRHVAVKVMLPQGLASAEALARFQREAELAQRLTHPNTVRLFDFGTTDRGAPFIVFELLEGRPLDVVLRDGGGLDEVRVARLGAQVLKSLMEAHALGVVHRDIKPSNLFLCDFSGERDYVKVLDFGIARVAGSAITLEATMLGTPAYMSPEQVSGGAIAAACDVYALGLVLAEALSGAPVFAGDSPLAVAMAQLSESAPPLPEIALRSALGPVIVRATRKDPESRYRTAEDMLAALEHAAATLPGAASGLRSDAAPARASVPAPTAALAPTSLAPAPAPRAPPTRHVFLRIGAAAAVGAGLVLALFVGLRRLAAPSPPHVFSATPPARSSRADGRARPAGRASAFTASHVRERLAELGYRVLSESTNTAAGRVLNQFVLTRDPPAIISLWRCVDEEDARNSEKMYRTLHRYAVAREGTMILFTDHHDGQRLIDQIVP